MSSTLQAAICQLQVSESKEDNLNRAGNMVREAAQAGARLVVLPEIFNVPYQIEALAQNAETFPGPSTDSLAELARNNKIVLVGGSIPEKDQSGQIYNSSFTFDEMGNLIGKHRKLHLFDIDIPGQISFQESAVLSPGESLQIIRHHDMVWAVIICYDIRFPELARLAALAGAQMLIVPAAFNTTTGPAHWELLMRARAIDNQFFVLAASPALNPAADYKAWGHSLAVDPWGTIICEAGTGEEIIYFWIDFSQLDQVRRELPLLKHRRTDIYNLTSRDLV